MYCNEEYSIDLVKKIIVYDFNTIIRLAKSKDNHLHIHAYNEKTESYHTMIHSGILEIKKNVKWYQHLFFLFRNKRELTLEIPNNGLIDIDIKTKNKNIVAEEGIWGNLSLKTTNSNIEIFGCKVYNIFGKTNNGSIRLMDVASKNDIELLTFNADINAEGVKLEGKMKCKTANAKIDCIVNGVPEDYQVKARTINAGVRVPKECRNGNKRIDLVTSNGAVTVAFKE